MKKLILVAAFSLATTFAHAGAMPRYQSFMSTHATVKSELDTRKASLKKGQYEKLSASLEASRKRMEDGVGRMVRGDYYVLADKEDANLAKIRAEIGAR